MLAALTRNGEMKTPLIRRNLTSSEYGNAELGISFILSVETLHGAPKAYAMVKTKSSAQKWSKDRRKQCVIVTGRFLVRVQVEEQCK